MVSINGGLKVYKAIEIQNGVPVPVGWRVGKQVQRAHRIFEEGGNILLVRA